MKPAIAGAYTALVTPFDSQGKLDENGLRKNIRFQLAHQIDGLVVLGTTGEEPSLTIPEKLRILSIAREETQGKCHLMVGTGSFSTRQTIENSLAAQASGADSVLVVTPYYNKPTQEGLYQHYNALSQAVKIPIVIYNIQGRTGVNLQTETLKRLSRIDSIVGVKEASGNILQMMDVIDSILSIRPDFSVMSGDDVLTFPLLSLGGHGVYSVLGNLLPSQIKNLCKSALEGDFATARSLHYEWLPMMQALFIETNPIPIKTALNLTGHAAGPFRLPLCQMTKENFERLNKVMETYGLLIYQT